MQIKIKDNAASLYISTNHHNHLTYNEDWAEKLRLIQGTIIEVETDCLFKDQFNTVPIKNISDKGLRIMISSVEKIFDDVRHNKIKCYYCGETFQHEHAIDKAKGQRTSDIKAFCPKCKTERTCNNLAWAAYCQNR